MKNVSVLIVVSSMITLLAGCAEVGPQEGGVRTSYIGISKGIGESEWFKQGVKSKSLTPGLYFSIPHMSEVDIYPVNELQYHMFKDAKDGRDDVSFKTKDGQLAWIDVSIRYRLIDTQLSVLHREFGPAYVENIIRPTVRSLINNKLGEHSATEVYDGKIRQQVASEVRDLINNGTADRPGTLSKGLEIVEIQLRRYEFTDEYQHAIEQKQIAVEQHLAAVELAKKREAEASGEKLATIQIAEAEAQRLQLEADAKLYAQLKEAEGIEAVGHAQAAAQLAMSEALGGGEVAVKMEFAKKLAASMQIWGIPMGNQSTSLMDLSGLFGSMIPQGSSPKPVKEREAVNP